MRLAPTAMAVVFGYAAIVGAAAQTNATREPADKTNRNVAEQITVTGCLERAEHAAVPTVGTTGATSVPPESFVLINAGSPTSVQGAAGGATYMVEAGSTRVSLASNVGHRVEVKGTATAAATSISAGGVPPPPEPHEAGSVTGGTPGTADTAASKNPRIRVASLRVLGDCSSSR
jgi:hypothetical protein